MAIEASNLSVLQQLRQVHGCLHGTVDIRRRIAKFWRATAKDFENRRYRARRAYRGHLGRDFLPRIPSCDARASAASSRRLFSSRAFVSKDDARVRHSIETEVRARFAWHVPRCHPTRQLLPDALDNYPPRCAAAWRRRPASSGSRVAR